MEGLGAINSDLHSVFSTFSQSEWSEKGYSVSRGSLTRDTVNELRNRADRILAGKYETGRAPYPFLPQPGSGQDHIAMYSHVHWSDSLFEFIARNRQLGSIASELLQVPVVRLWATSLICKTGAPNGLSDVRWHRDMTSWQCVNQPRLLTYWIALDDTDECNGCLEFAVASHLIPQNRGSLRDDDLKDLTSETVPMRSGQISVHHCLTGHRSNANRTNGVRRALTIHLMDGRLSYIPDSPSDDHMNVALIGKVEACRIDGSYFPVTYHGT